MNKTNKFLYSLNILNKTFLKPKNKSEHNLKTTYLIEHNKSITQILDITENDKYFLCAKKIGLLNRNWISIPCCLEDIKVLVEDRLNPS